MSYVARSLGPNERVEYVAKLHWVTYGSAVLLLILGALLYLVWHLGGYLLLAAGVVYAIVIYIYNNTIELAVTNHKVVAKTGFIARQTIEQRLEKIDAIDVQQTVLGRVLGYGNIEIRGTGINSTPVRLISDPLTFRRRVEQAIEAKAPGALAHKKDDV